MSVLCRIRAARLACAAAIAVLGALALAPGAGAAKIGGTYLALGDSLAYGFHEALFEEELAKGEGICVIGKCIKPGTFDHSYVDDFGAILRLFRPDLEVINDGCPGETAETLINGPSMFTNLACAGGPGESLFPLAWLHHPYARSPNGSQLSDALAILAENPHVSPITLDIGGNDLTDFLGRECGFPQAFTCTEERVRGEIAQIAANVYWILTQLRSAASKAQIVLIGLYNPYPTVIGTAGTGDRFVAAFNAAQAAVAAKVPGTRFANPEPPFNPSLLTGAPEASDLRTICLLTGMCPGGTFDVAGDFHPSNYGYRVIAGVLALAFFKR